MRITSKIRVKQNTPVTLTPSHRVMVTWLEYQGDQRFLMTRDFESTADALQFSARMNVPVEIETV